MRKLIRLEEGKYFGVDQIHGVNIKGSIEEVAEALESVGVSPDSIDTAVTDMYAKHNNVADFGSMRGDFLFSARLTSEEIENLLDTKQ